MINIINTRNGRISAIVGRKQKMSAVICLSSTQWDFLHQRPQQLMTQFSRDFKVAYINPPGTPGERLKHINPNLVVFTPPRPAGLLPGPEARKYLTRVMREFIHNYAFTGAILWFNMPEAGYLCGNLEEKLVIYDCLDDFASFSWSPGHTREADLYMTERADIVLAVSEVLHRTKSQRNRNCFLIPNGCDFAHFQKAADKSLPVPNDLKQIQKPRIGFIGALYEWVDFELIKHLATAGKSWSIVLVGPKQGGIKTPNLPNIYYTGLKPYPLLPDYLRGFDLCIIPFRLTPAALSSSPIKLYEYLAAGKPVVATGIPEVGKFGGVVEIAGNREEFAEKISLLLQERDDERDRRRGLQLGIARANTWESRYHAVKKILYDFHRI